MTDRIRKLERIMAILDAAGADQLELTTPENLAWFFDGARVAVPLGGPPVFTASVRRDGCLRVTAFANELERLRSEELSAPAGSAIRFEPAPWHAPLPVGVGLRDSDLVDELRAARAALLPLERRRFAELGADLAALCTRVLSEARSADTERELASRLAGAVVACGAEPVVLLVAGESRLHHRHPLPTTARLGGRAMVAVGARRYGLVGSLTRWLDFRSATASDLELALFEVEADALDATRPGRELGDVLTEIVASYERHGLGADAWLGHHQGGPTGYLGRDPRAAPGSRVRIVSGQAFAWNPTAPGAKVEDTVVVDDDGITVLTADPDWPVVDVRGRPRPLALHLPTPSTHKE
ncbi:MAG: M24 family metallopeptidase [Herbiconiux sp.]|nr:M24 family metallopeptidase [Herbiconiux sp.]